MKKIILLFPLLVFLLLLAGCPAPWILENHPSSQRDTTWTTADNRVQFYIPKDYSDMTGEFRSSNSEVLFQISFGPYDPYVSIYAWRGEESVIRDNEIELWKSISVKPGKYTVRVEETTYFTPGEILTFYCVDGNHLERPGISASRDRKAPAGGEKIPTDRPGYSRRCGGAGSCNCCAPPA